MKFVYRTLIALVLLIIICLIGVHFYFSPARLQTLIQPRLQNALQRTITFQDAELHYGFEPSLNLSNLVIHDRKSFSQIPFIQSQNVQITLSPIAFFMGQNKIGTLHLKDSHIYIRTNKQGQYNVDDLMQKKQTRLPINQLQLTNTTLSYHNTKSKRHSTLQIKNATLLATQHQKGIGLMGEVAVQRIIMQTQTDTTHIPALDIATQLVYVPKTKDITFNKLAIHLGPLTTNLSGQIRGQNLAIDLQTQDQPLDFDHIRTYLIEQNLLSPQTTLSGKGQLDLSISGVWPPKIKGHFKTTALSLADPNRLKNPIINGEIDLSIAGSILRLHALKFQSGLTDIALSGIISNVYKRPQISFAWHSGTADMDGFFPLPKTTQAEWGLISPAHAARDTKKSALISLLNSIDMDGSVRADSLRLYNTWIRNFNATTQAQNGVLNIKPITGQTHGGALNGNLVFSTHKQGADLESHLSLINARANPLFNQTLNWHIPLYGDITLTSHLKGALDTTLTYLPPSPQANGRLQMQTGKIVKWDVLQNNLKSVEQLGLLSADKVPLQNATLIFNLKGKTLILNGTQLTAANMSCRAGGTGELGGLLNYTLDVDVPPSNIQFGGFNLGALLGKRTIPVRINISGSSRAPKVTAGLR
ncbi:MAG: AsmA family protein [Candidatus Latescibacteria bacterium]|nr:AsmA family protein [Candidatus Latescibacterota bacterium]